MDEISSAADLRTLSPEDSSRLGELLKMRPMELCLFFRMLYGSENMERIFADAIAEAKAAEIAEF